MAQVDIWAAEATKNPAGREKLIRDYSAFILACAARAAGHAVDRSDDEWAVALGAFNEAIDCYAPERGSFLSHARLVISRRLTDFLRAGYRRREVYVPPEAFREDESGNVAYEVVEEYGEPDMRLRDELIRANRVLDDYGFSFFDLAGRTPKKKRPRAECSDAVNGLTETPPLLAWMRAKRRLPLAKLCEISGARKKTLSFFRYFVITGAEILTRDFPSLKRYFSFLREEAGR